MLKVADLSCERDDRILFSKLDFSLKANEALQIQGSNGSGKTTLLRIVCGLNSEFEGRIDWQGQDIKRARTRFLQDIFYLGHAPAINRTLTPRENLLWFCALRGYSGANDIHEALGAFGLKGYDDFPCHLMSAGQQRRVSLARIKLSRAKLLVLDEPFTALDKTGVTLLENYLSEFVNAGGSLLLTTHHPLAMDCTLKTINLDERQAAMETSHGTN